ncbi:hypothetical protein ABT214_26990, partial [Micromonospora purpureochromogenes]|uniref:hypothetical protein n=1 Tax=Micromonospora purpureochromogenes TaxID=47872 RepID=UPI00332A659A
TGLHPDVPNGRVALRPLAGPELGALSVQGLRVAGARVDVHVDATGQATLANLPPTLTLTTPTVPSPRHAPDSAVQA